MKVSKVFNIFVPDVFIVSWVTDHPRTKHRHSLKLSCFLILLLQYYDSDWQPIFSLKCKKNHCFFVCRQWHNVVVVVLHKGNSFYSCQYTSWYSPQFNQYNTINTAIMQNSTFYISIKSKIFINFQKLNTTVLLKSLESSLLIILCIEDKFLLSSNNWTLIKDFSAPAWTSRTSSCLRII